MFNKKRFIHILLVIILIVLFLSCGGGKMKEETVTLRTLDSVEQEKLNSLKYKKIFFGHQSVGKNILDGVEMLSDIPIIKLEAPQSSIDPGISHAYVGENTKPGTKIEAFRNYIESGLGNELDIAFLKFCYVDILPNTDVETLFNDYTGMVEEMKNRYPNVNFVHLTAPLMSHDTGIKPTIKKFLGRTVRGYEDNVEREKYNKLLRDKYQGREPLFDIAYFESVSLEGKRITYELGGQGYYTLVPELTYDGGHLNDKGKRHIAEQLLIFLSDLQ